VWIFVSHNCGLFYYHICPVVITITVEFYLPIFVHFYITTDRRHLVDITPLVGLGPQGQRQYFDPWFFWRDYPRLLQYITGEVRPERYFVYKLAPLVAVAADAAGYDLTTGQIRPMGLEERIGATVKDMVDLFLPAGTWQVPGAGLSTMGGWSATPTGRFDLPRQVMEWAGLRTFPGARPAEGRSLTPETKARIQEAARQGILGKRRILQPRKGQYPERLALEPQWEAWLGSVLGKKPTQEEILASLDVLGLAPEVRKKAIRNIFSPESIGLFTKYFGARPTPRGLWEMRLIFAQDNPADRERVLQYLTAPEQIRWLAQVLGRPYVTAADVVKYHRQLLRREKPQGEEGTLGPGAALRRVEAAIMGR